MKYLVFLIEGADLKDPKPNIDALAAKGRLGMLDAKSEDSMSFIMKLLGCDGSGSGEGKICLRCSPVSLDGEGNTGSIPASDEGLGALAEAVEAMEIDGIKFEAMNAGRDIIITMAGEGLSPRIIPNKCSPGMPLPQIGAASKSAKRTASVLNKLLYRLAKGKKNVTFSITGNAFQFSHTFSERFGLSGCCISDDALVKAIAQCLGMDVMGFEGAKSIESALGSHDFVFFTTSEKTEDFDEEVGQLKDIKSSENLVMVLVFRKAPGEPMPALVCGGGLLPGNEKRFSETACSRGFRMDADALLPWVLKATS